jgi:hypothetical protein
MLGLLLDSSCFSPFSEESLRRMLTVTFILTVKHVAKYYTTDVNGEHDAKM